MTRNDGGGDDGGDDGGDGGDDGDGDDVYLIHYYCLSWVYYYSFNTSPYN